MASNNPKHVFDFEGILNMNADPAHWKKLKKQLEDAFGELKIAIQEGMAEEEAQKYVNQFNKIFRKAKLPEIGLDDLREDFAKLEVNVEKAVAAINNIEIDRLDDVLYELKLINGEVEKISKNKGGIKLFDDANLKKVMTDIERIAQSVAKTTNPLIRSVSQIDQAIARAKLSAADINEAMEFQGRGKGKKGEADVTDYFEEYNRVKNDEKSTWEEQYYWLVKFNKAYESFMTNQKDPKVIASMKKYTALYNQAKAGDADRRNMLQNIVNRGQGKDLVGYTKEPWALENTLQEIKSILQGGLNVNVGEGGKADSKNVVGGDNVGGNADVVDALKQIKDTLSKGIVISRNDDPDGVQGTEKQIDALINSFVTKFKKLDVESPSYDQEVDDLANKMTERFEKMFPGRNFNEGDVGDAFSDYAENEDKTILTDSLYDVIKRALPKVSAEIDFSELEQILKKIIYKVQFADGKEIKTEDIASSEKEVSGEHAQQTVAIDAGALAEALGNLQITSDNSDVVNELKTLAQNLGNLVAQEDTLQAIKNSNNDITREDISTAIKEGIYAKEISGQYREAEYIDAIDPLADGYYSRVTGVLHSSIEEALEEFQKFIKGKYFVPKGKDFLDVRDSDFKSKSDVLNDVISNLSASEDANQDSWVRVIVDAINTQGGKIVESIKLLLPQEITDGVDDTKLVNAFNILTSAIQDLGTGARNFFEKIVSGGAFGDDKLREALETLGLTTNGKPSLKMATTGAINNGVAISDNFVVSSQPNDGYGIRDIAELIKKQNKVYEAGGAVSRIISGFESESGNVYQLQARAPGVNHRKESSGVLDATDEQIDRLLYTFEQMRKEGLYPELRGDNIMFDKDKGFTVIDLSLRDAFHEGLDNPDRVIETFLRSVGHTKGASQQNLDAFKQRVWSRHYTAPEDRLVNANTIAAEKQAQAQAAARQKNAKGVNVAVDNSDVVEAINKLGESLGTTVAQEDTLQAIRDNNNLTKEDIAGVIRENANTLTKEDVVSVIKEGMPALQEETTENEAPWAREDTLGTVKSVLEKIQTNTANLNGAEIKQAVDANTQVAQQAAGAVSTQMEDVATSSDLDKIIRKQVMTPDGAKTVAQVQVHSELTDEAFRTVKDQFAPDEDGEFQLVFREVIDDLDKLRKANKKDAEAVTRAQKKVNEFLAKFESKTGGNARFVEGFGELKNDVANPGFINKDNIDEVYNRMLELQRKYAELETNFRKGQSSLNPFVNAINKAQNIENIFGAVEIKFNGLVEKSEELTAHFTKLRSLSESIKQFTDRMVNDPDSITPADFTEFSKQMGEFTATKTQVDGLLKNEAKLNKNIVADQKARIKEWVSLSKQLGVLEAKINSGLFDDTVVEQARKEYDLIQKKIDAIMPLINEPSGHLVTVGDANVSAQDKATNAQMSKRIGVLAGQYEKLGKLQARAEKAGTAVEREKYEQLKREVEAEMQTMRLNEEQNEGLLRALQLHQETAYVNEKDLTIAKDRKRLFNEWIELVKQISVLDTQIESGLFDEVTVNNAKMARDNISKQIDAILPQLDLTREDYVFAGAESMKSEQETLVAQRQKLFKALAGDYAKLGEAQAQAEVKQTDAAKERVAQLSREIASKREILNLSEDELEILEAIGNQAKDDNARLLGAKDRDKAARAELQAQKKLSKRQALVGKAGSAIGRADSVWLETTTLDRNAMPPEFLERVRDYEKRLDALKVKHNTLSNSPGPVTKKQKAQLIAQTNEVNALTSEIGELIDQYQRLSGSNVKELEREYLGSSSNLNAYKKELTAAVMEATEGKAQIKGFNWETKTLTYTVKTGAHEFTEYTAAVRELDHQMVSLRGSTKRTETFLEATKRKMGEISSYMSGMAIFSRVSQELKRGIQYIREIDLALTELRKVTDETEEEYDQFLQTAAKTGARLGTTISAVTEATATFAKLGYTMVQATEMAEAAIVYKNVGDNIASTGDAADSIISTLKGFGMEASEAMAIVDRFNEVGE